MSLDSLFTDRKARKYIRESIDLAEDYGKGVCDCCGQEGFLLEAFGRHLCENCCTKAIDISNDYGNVFESYEFDGDYVISLVNEGYMVPDFEKLQKDANAKFNGSIKELMKSYGLFIESYWNDKFLDGMLYISSKDIRSGSGKVNKFLIDYDAYYSSKRGFSTIKPDADGTEVPKRVVPQSRLDKNIQLAAQDTINAPHKRGVTVSTPVSQPNTVSATTQKVPKTKKPMVSAAPKVFKGKLSISGDEDHMIIKVGHGQFLSCTKTSDNGNSKIYEVECANGNKFSYTIDSEGKDFNFIADKIIDSIIEEPSQVLSGFDGIHKNTFDINAYSIYQFVLDKQSFCGDNFSVAILYDGKVRPNNRVFLSDKAITSRASLIGEITQYMEDSIKKKYPVLFDKHNIVNTSIGKAVFTFKGFDDSGDPVVVTTIGNKPITGKFAKDDSAWTDLDNAEKNLRTVIDTAIRMGNDIIPNFNNSPNYVPSSKPGKDEFLITVNDNKPEEHVIHAQYSADEFIDTGNITFLMYAVDTRTAMSKPDEPVKIVYRRAGTSIDDFIKSEGEKIYRHYFSKSDMSDVMTKSAQDKMKNPSKKQGLFSKIADIFVRRHKEIQYLKDLEVSSTLEVNSDGKVTNATIIITDPYKDFVEDSKSLHDLAGLDKKINYLKFMKADPKMKDGPSVTYVVKDINKFSDDMNLKVLESLIFEAFGIVNINEDGRKVFHF